MSWDSYIDNLLQQTKDASGEIHADKACIISLDGGSPWTTNGHPNALILEGAEGSTIAKVMKTKDFTPFHATGVRAGGDKYQFLRAEDERTVLAKMKEKGALTIGTSKSAIVIAHTIEGMQQGNTNKGKFFYNKLFNQFLGVGVITDYLESLGM